MIYSLTSTADFDKDFFKLDNSERQKVENKAKKLKDDPYRGDPLGYKWFRELKLNGKRVYFLVYEDKKSIVLVALSDKKTQQATIDSIKEKLDYYKELFD